MAQTHTQRETGAQARNGKGVPKQLVVEEDRAAWEGMTQQPPQQSHTSPARRLLNKARDVMERGAMIVRRALKSRD